MTQYKLEKVFKKAKYEAAPGLADSVWMVIVAREKRANRLKLWAFAFAGLISLGGLLPAFKILLNNLAQSGFYEYFSLIFTAGRSIFSYWQELAFSLAESLPVMSIVLTLSLAFTFFLSLKYVIKQINGNTGSRNTPDGEQLALSI